EANSTRWGIDGFGDLVDLAVAHLVEDRLACWHVRGRRVRPAAARDGTLDVEVCLFQRFLQRGTVICVSALERIGNDAGQRPTDDGAHVDVLDLRSTRSDLLDRTNLWTWKRVWPDAD